MHKVLNTPIHPPFSEGSQMIMFGMGCFWGAEKMLWETQGVICTHVGFSGGHTENPSYMDVCGGFTGHAEVVRVVYDPSRIRFQDLLKVFWEGHDPTQGERQGYDFGEQYKSTIYTYSDSQFSIAVLSRNIFQESLSKLGFGNITTEIAPAKEFYYAEEYHQQYLAEGSRVHCLHEDCGAKFDPDCL